MMKFAVLLALVACASAAVLPKIVEDDAQVAAELAALNPAARISGGSDATIDQVPYVVSLRQFDSHICGASVIASRWIITAASCVSGGRRDSYSMRAGSTSCINGGEIYHFGRIVIHQGYRKNVYGVPSNDIAILRLSLYTTIPFDSSCRAIPLFKSGDVAAAGTEAVISGWGATRDFGPSIFTTLQSASVPIVTSTSCRTAYNAYATTGGLPIKQICAGSADGRRGFCQGDTGSALVINGRLAGIASWGLGCAQAGYPGVYTEVAPYEDWIKTNMERFNIIL